MEFDKSTIKTASPVYTLTNIETMPTNPYREFVHYAAYSVLPTLEKNVNLSLKEFGKLDIEKMKEIIKEAENFASGARVNFKDETSHKRIFLEGSYFLNNIELCSFKFYNHLSYTATDNNSQNDELHYAVELDFTMNNFLDFLQISSYDNFFDFSKDDSNSLTIDMFMAFLKTFANSTDFIKVFKAKSLVTKNIQLFADKLVRPYVVDMNIIYTPEHFLIGAVCGTDIIKQSYDYDNYLEHIKQFAANIRAKYGDKYKLEKETAEKQE